MKTEEKEQWMTCPRIDNDLYPGLSYLSTLNKLIVAKKRDALHNLFGKNIIGYTIYNGHGQKVFIAVQRRESKKVEIKIFNYYGNEVINLRRPRAFCLNRILIWAPPGNFLGSIQGRKCRGALIKNDTDNVLLKIKSRGLFCCVHDILSEGESVGEVETRICCNSIQNNVSIIFPVEMNVEHKSILLGACFLIGA
ncbi:unnamed protein product [Leptosia nina]|uniref:Phospholipid scramblase n=1 Tax=Leptosia nina TaxID=320188 RepID=A0AAV1JEA7_9NEOP